MKVSLNWIRQFTEIDMSVDQLVERIGSQLGAVEEVIDVGKKYQGVVVARVVTCEKHPNADKLSLCLIDDNGAVRNVARSEQGYVQVVCGAPNVREGMLVAWLPPGVIVPSTYDKDPFVLEARELRGYVSNGMLASASELAISDDHDGILEIDVAAVPGSAFAEVYGLNDYVIDIENKMFTHRPDCFGILGVAREIAGITNRPFTSPDWYQQPLERIKPGPTRLPLVVRNEAPELVARFMAVAMADVTMRKSPVIIQTYLSRLGLRPINNIVDATNYLMILTGQPLHAYDYDKVLARSGDVPMLVARQAAAAETVKLLNGKTIQVDAPTVVIATDRAAIGIAGVMGGADTEVNESTKNIILECASFDMYNVRRTSMKHGLFTDAVTRFNKGQPPLQNERVLDEAVATLQYVSGAHVASQVFDESPELPVPPPITVSNGFINDRLGLQLSAEEMAVRLRNVEMLVQTEAETLTVTPPFWRTDLERSEDIVEEVGRLYGFDHLRHELPKRNLMPPAKNRELALKTSIREALSRAGANEVLTYSFVHGKLLDAAGQSKELAYELSNALSPDLQYYRLSLTPSLLEKVYGNIRNGYESFAIFELGKAHRKDRTDLYEPKVPHEEQLLSFTIAKSKAVSPAYFEAQHYLRQLFAALGFMHDSLELKATSDEYAGDQLLKPFDASRSAAVWFNGQCVGFVGEYTRGVRKALKLPVFTAGFEIRFLPLLHGLQQGYRPLSRYPKVAQDISLRVPSEVSYAQLYSVIAGELLGGQDDSVVSSLEPLDIYQKEPAATHKQLAFRYTITSYERTLVAEEVNAMLDAAAAKARDVLGAERL